MTLAPYYRLYDLPWSPTEEVERRFRKVVRNAFIVFAVFAILIPLLPVPERDLAKAPDDSGPHRQAGAREEGAAAAAAAAEDRGEEAGAGEEGRAAEAAAAEARRARARAERPAC